MQGCTEFGKRFPQSTVYCSKPNKIAPNKSILFSVRAPVGRLNIADSNYCIGRGVASIIPTNIDRDFLYLYLDFISRKLQNISQGSTFESINSAQLNDISIEKPIDKKEQTAIAQILSTVDKAIEQTEKLIAKYQRIKTGLMQDLLTKGIDEKGNIRSEKTHKFKNSRLGRIPVEWEVKELQNIIEKIGDGIHATPMYVESSDFYFINGNNLMDDKVVFTPKTNCVNSAEYKKYLIDLNERTILMSINGTIGNTALYKEEKVILGKSVAYIKCKKETNCGFLYRQLQSSLLKHYFENELTGSTIKNLSLASIRSAPIPIPVRNPNEQKMISDKIDSIDRQLTLYDKNATQLHSIKSGLMQDLLSGRVKVGVTKGEKNETQS